MKAVSLLAGPDRGRRRRAGEPRLTAIDTFHDLNIDTTDFHLGVHAGETDRGGLVLTEPDTYIAYCSVPGHREAGMKIAIVVRPEPAETDPSSV